MSIVDRLRKGRQIAIDINPATLIMKSYPTVDNGYGTQGPDRAQAPVERVDFKARIANYKKVLPGDNGEEGTPVTAIKIFYITTDFENVLAKDEFFDYNGVNYKVIKPEIVRKYGEIIGYRSDLEIMS